MAGDLQVAGEVLGVVKEVEEAADKALDLADKGLDLREKFEIVEDNRQRRKVDAFAHKVNAAAECVNQVEQAADGMADLVDKAANKVIDYKEQADIYKDNEFHRKMGRAEREVDAAVNIYTKVRPVAADMTEAFAPYLKKLTNSRSEVQMGFCRGCKLAMFGSKACIVADSEAGELIFLTSDTISSCSFARKNYHKTKLKNYYYYELTFKNGQKSSIRMNKRYRDALERYTTVDHNG